MNFFLFILFPCQPNQTGRLGFFERAAVCSGYFVMTRMGQPGPLEQKGFVGKSPSRSFQDWILWPVGPIHTSGRAPLLSRARENLYRLRCGLEGNQFRLVPYAGAIPPALAPAAPRVACTRREFAGRLTSSNSGKGSIFSHFFCLASRHDFCRPCSSTPFFFFFVLVK